MDEAAAGVPVSDDQAAAEEQPTSEPNEAGAGGKLVEAGDFSKNDTAARHRYRLTVEPVIFLLLTASALSSTVLQALYLERTCEQDLHRDPSHCVHLNVSDNSIEQPHAANLLMGKSVLEALLPASLTLFLGPWSDRNGRKPLMAVALAGHVLTYAAYAGLSVPPRMPPRFLLLGSVPLALTGGFIAIILSCFSYIADVSPTEHRSFRLSIVDTSICLSYMVGYGCSAPLLDAVGYVGVFSTCAGLCFLALLYALLLLPESVRIQESDNSLPFCKTAKVLVARVFTVCFAKRPGNRRAVILLAAIVLACIVLTYNGDGAIMYLFTVKKFGWGVAEYTHLVLAGLTLSILGTTVGVYLLVNVLHLNEALVAAITCTFKVLGYFLNGFSPQPWFLYLAAAVSFPGTMASSLARSVLSKCVPPEDVGKVFSLTAFLEAVMPLAAVPLYTQVYNATITIFPGAFMLVSAGTFTLNICLLSVVAYLLHKHGPGVPYQQLPEADPINF